MEIIGYVAVILVAAVGGFWACRFIDHVFNVKETEIESVYKAGLLREAREEIGWLSDDLIKKFNDSAMDMYKKFMGGDREE